MFRSIAEMSLRSKIEKENAGRKKQFVPWDKAEKIALVLHQGDGINKSMIDKFIDGSKKFIEVFYVDTGAKEPAYADWHCFSKKDASWLGLPKPAALIQFKNKKFDLVLCTANEDSLFASAVAASLPATCKCSSSEAFNLADLVVKKNDPYNVIDYLNEVIRYLKMIKV